MGGTPKRVATLPGSGRLLVSTDLHGNLEDFAAMRRRFEADPQAVWVQLGDVVHGPDGDSRRERPALYDYPDESWAIVEQCIELRTRHPARFLFVIGNHDHGHVGGPHPAKFHEDEVERLETTLAASQLESLRGFLGEALLAVIAPCGLLLTHGVPSDRLRAIDQLDGTHFDPARNDPSRNEVLRDVLTSYGQPPEVVTRMLASLSRSCGRELHVVVHGHDRDEAGWYTEGPQQLGLCVFGAPRENKRFLRADLSASYRSTADLREGVEILRLHGTP